MVEKKLSHKEIKERIKEDELRTLTVRLVQFFRTEGNRLLSIVLAILVVGAVIWVFKQYRDKANDEAAVLLNEVKNSLEKDKATEAMDYLTELVSRYPRTTSGKLAALVQIALLQQEGKYQESLEMIEKISPKVPEELKSRLVLLKGTALESLNQLDQASDLYRNALETYKGTAIEDELRIALGRVLEAAHKNTEALECYKVIKEESVWYPLAKRRLEWLEATTAGQADVRGQNANS